MECQIHTMILKIYLYQVRSINLKLKRRQTLNKMNGLRKTNHYETSEADKDY